ncbi:MULTISPECIES: TIGR01777 family oxidoreductase [unclassified Pseudomonas]|uniref:TIGR01777 family oxidoreductase n=1 Tax=unclassified Pseudomonas TaxID=196821 RepID=UPI00244D2871|nr:MULTISPECIES: TIGR01777 family oxidoreductase [unclassified Pseudomonas]MDG9922711.1 TIGR01777 family oxidoreductase [Pseudomonas sp. GD04045]MDH0033156.1 TIGR01777 family oxidoreductase [Pseudomonas sp. GD04019]
MQNLLYRWLLLVGLGHVALGIALAFAAHLPVTQPYFDYLYASVATAPPPAEFQTLLRTMVGLFGPTVASWGLLFSLLVFLYREHGHRQIKPAIFAALLVWCLLDSAISLYFGLLWHAYLNTAAVLSIAIPLVFLQPRMLERETVLQLRHPPARRLRILLTGGSGFIGSPLASSLSQAGHDVLVLTRDLANVRHIRGRITCLTSLEQIASDERIDCIINLAGEPLAESRWNEERKRRFLQSRLTTTDALLSLVQRLEHKPDVLLNGSAVGYYGHWQDEELDENSAARSCFSHQLCAQWEERARQMEAFGVRVCLLRIGVVLGRDGGPLQELRRSFDLGVAAQLGNGQQWMPWIHLHDVLDICVFLLANPNIQGPINLTAPEPVTHAGFCTLLKRQLPSALISVRVPTLLVRMLVGEMADEVLLSGQRVLPAKLLEHGYAFRYPELAIALRQLTAAR